MELKPHNQKAVNEVVKCFNNGSKTVIYTAGTGCGKSWVFMGSVSKLNDQGFFKKERPQVLYIMPKYAIKDNIEGYDEFNELNCSVDFVTFNYFNNFEKGMKKISKYDFIVVDECHHLGADIYGKTIVKCMENTDKCFLGLTATPYRDFDKVDVSVFFDDTVYEISVFDAIHMGLMPMFNYHICLPEKDIKQLEKEYENEIRAVVDYTDSAEAVYEIVTKYNRNKCICFFASKKDIYNAMPIMREIFEGYNIHILLSNLRNLEQVMDAVRNEEKSVILSVNMLLEGCHLDGVDMIVFYRNVGSTIVFQQCLGRVCSIGKETEPVVIDVSETARKILAKLLAENKNYKGKNYVPTKGGHKDIMRVGIGSVIEYDINKVLRLCDRNFAKQEALKESTEKALEKYRSFKGGENYKTFEELKNSGLDYQKFKACCELYHITAEAGWNCWKAG